MNFLYIYLPEKMTKYSVIANMSSGVYITSISGESSFLCDRDGTWDELFRQLVIW